MVSFFIMLFRPVTLCVILLHNITTGRLCSPNLPVHLRYSFMHFLPLLHDFCKPPVQPHSRPPATAIPLIEAIPHDTRFATTAPAITPITANQFTVLISTLSLSYSFLFIKYESTRIIPTGGRYSSVRSASYRNCNTAIQKEVFR